MYNCKKSFLCTLVLALILSFTISTTSVSAESTSYQDEYDEGIDISKLDKEYLNAAEQALKNYGNGKTFTLSRAYKLDWIENKTKMSCWYLESKSKDAVIILDRKTAKIVSIKLEFSKKEISSPAAVTFKSANELIQNLAPPRFNIEKAYFEKDFLSKKEHIQIVDSSTYMGQYLIMKHDLKSNEVSTAYQFIHPIHTLDNKYRQTAEVAIGHLTPKQPVPFNYAVRTNDKNGIEYWNFQTIVSLDEEEGDTNENYIVYSGNELQSVYIHGESGKVLSAGLSNVLYFKGLDNKYTKEEAVQAAKPLIDKILGVDITGYTAFFDKKMYQLSLYKKDGVIIHVQFNESLNVNQVEFGF
ncbi:hypothetical protein [Paenibacillus agilis]|uniref:PepSY domain-containing protein n=1 Tax=Paenibacillus agilis TaxID=3020863 RepID=A0A559ICK8_9BACL|nr:hypothetical protein [Paenibacillus agilis]TVX85250.1 hypothetical protein FPZ44_25345 [Paenibacillus agilis]